MISDWRRMERRSRSSATSCPSGRETLRSRSRISSCMQWAGRRAAASRGGRLCPRFCGRVPRHRSEAGQLHGSGRCQAERVNSRGGTVDHDNQEAVLAGGNQCAFPGCRNRLVDKVDVLIGEVCHICADKPGGKRYDPQQTEAERQALANLIVLCPNHHTVVDSDDTDYTVAALREMKRQHEAKSIKPFVISDELAARIVAFMAVYGRECTGRDRTRDWRGDQGGCGRASVAKEEPEREVHRRASPDAAVRAKGRNSALRCRPCALRCLRPSFPRYSKPGWRDLGGLEVDPASNRGTRPELVLVFSLLDPHQVSNAKQAIDEVFAKSGFVKEREHDRDAYE